MVQAVPERRFFSGLSKILFAQISLLLYAQAASLTAHSASAPRIPPSAKLQFGTRETASLLFMRNYSLSSKLTFVPQAGLVIYPSGEESKAVSECSKAAQQEGKEDFLAWMTYRGQHFKDRLEASLKPEELKIFCWQHGLHSMPPLDPQTHTYSLRSFQRSRSRPLLATIPTILPDGIAKFQFCPAIQYSFNETSRLKAGIDFSEPLIGPKGSAIYTEWHFDPSYAFVNIHNLFLFQLRPNRILFGWDKVRPTYAEFGYVHNFTGKRRLTAWGIVSQYSIPSSRRPKFLKQYFSLSPYIECRFFKSRVLKDVAFRFYLPILPNLDWPAWTIHLGPPKCNRDRPLGYDQLCNFDLYNRCAVLERIPELVSVFRRNLTDYCNGGGTEKIRRIFGCQGDAYWQSVRKVFPEDDRATDEITEWFEKVAQQNPWLYLMI